MLVVCASSVNCRRILRAEGVPSQRLLSNIGRVRAVCIFATARASPAGASPEAVLAARSTASRHAASIAAFEQPCSLAMSAWRRRRPAAPRAPARTPDSAASPRPARRKVRRERTRRERIVPHVVQPGHAQARKTRVRVCVADGAQRRMHTRKWRLVRGRRVEGLAVFDEVGHVLGHAVLDTILHGRREN
jgi:hypothetical protein